MSGILGTNLLQYTRPWGIWYVLPASELLKHDLTVIAVVVFHARTAYLVCTQDGTLTSTSACYGLLHSTWIITGHVIA